MQTRGSLTASTDANNRYTAMPSDPQQADARRNEGFQALAARQVPRAEETFAALVTEGSQDPQVRFGLAMALYEQGRLEESRSRLAEACAIEPGFVHAWLYLGVVNELLGRRRPAAGAYLRADRLMNRADPAAIPPDVRELLARGGRHIGEELHAALAAELEAVAREHGAGSVPQMTEGVDIFTGRAPPRFAHPRWRPGLFYVPGLPPRTFYEREEFPWAETVEARTDAIREELRAAMADMKGFEPYVQYPPDSPDARIWKGINGSREWSTLHLARHGSYIEEPCARCPQTVAALRAIPDLHDVPGYGPEIMFSVLRPKTLIPSHRGSVNSRVIVHLPLVVPVDCGYLRVCDEKRGWQEGRLMMFDDTFDHEAWNGTDEVRVVLIFDVWNPRLSIPEREAFRRVMARSAEFERALLDLSS